MLNNQGALQNISKGISQGSTSWVLHTYIHIREEAQGCFVKLPKTGKFLFACFRKSILNYALCINYALFLCGASLGSSSRVILQRIRKLHKAPLSCTTLDLGQPFLKGQLSVPVEGNYHVSTSYIVYPRLRLH